MSSVNTEEKKQDKVEESKEILDRYNQQTEDDNIHFSHIDGYTYGDYSDSCCC